MDFGLAKRFAPDELGATTTSVAHTKTGMLIGTPHYMSPEQALGRALDPRTDIFSLGVVLYELVAGQRPFLGHTVGETINNIVNQPPAALGLENPVFSPMLDGIIFKCLEKEPEKRYASAKELAADLRKLKDDSERALSATAQEKVPAPGVTPPPGEPQLTALWKLAAKAGASRNAALRWMIGLVAVGLLTLGGWVLLRSGGAKPPVPGTNPTGTALQKSVAVLPFVNMSADKADEYLSDGISEEIITALSKIKGLKVPARTSCFVFKDKNEDIQKIGQQLHVRTVLEGSISKVGNKVRVTAQLINLADGFHIWSETYDRALDDLLAIRTDVAARVAEALKGQLLGEERQQLAKRTTDNAEAYRLYLQGRYLWNRRTGKYLKQAIEYFNQAIGKDPSYALAYAGLADCYVLLSEYTGLPARETFPQARAAALKALELDSNLAEPHATLADIKAYFDWDWSGGEVEFRRAIELNPNYATAHQWYAGVLDSLHRFEEALAESKRAQEIDPLSPVINAYLGFELMQCGKEDSAIEVLQKQIALDPSFIVAHECLGLACLKKGLLSQALAEFETMHRLDGSGTYDLCHLGFAYARAGRTNEARKILAQMQARQQQGFDCCVSVAVVQHALGDDEGTLNSLEKALAEHSTELDWLHFDPYFKDLRPHPRVHAILKKMNLVK